jgi:hypothetical protein
MCVLYKGEAQRLRPPGHGAEFFIVKNCSADWPQPKWLHTDQKTTRQFLNYQRGFLIRVE